MRRHILTLTLSHTHTHTHTQTSLTSFDLDHDTMEIPEDLPLLPDYDRLVARSVYSNVQWYTVSNIQNSVPVNCILFLVIVVIIFM